MRSKLSRCSAILLLVQCLAGPTSAHEEPAAQIGELSRVISTDLRNAALYLDRAHYYRLNGQSHLAEEDLRAAERLLPGSPGVKLIRAAMLRDDGRLIEAQLELDAVVAIAPDLAAARTLRAEIAASLGRQDAAIADLDAAIASSRRPDPDLYLGRARLIANGQTPDLGRALDGLDAGLRRLGASPALEAYAVDVEVRAGQIERALKRLDGMIARAARKETLLARRGGILAAVGRDIEAWATYSEAMTAIETLPAFRRHTSTMVALETEVRAALREASVDSISSKGLHALHP